MPGTGVGVALGCTGVDVEGTVGVDVGGSVAVGGAVGVDVGTSVAVGSTVGVSVGGSVAVASDVGVGVDGSIVGLGTAVAVSGTTATAVSEAAITVAVVTGRVGVPPKTPAWRSNGGTIRPAAIRRTKTPSATRGHMPKVRILAKPAPP